MIGAAISTTADLPDIDDLDNDPMTIGWFSWFGLPLIIRSQIKTFRSRLQTSPCIA